MEKEVVYKENKKSIPSFRKGATYANDWMVLGVLMVLGFYLPLKFAFHSYIVNVTIWLDLFSAIVLGVDSYLYEKKLRQPSQSASDRLKKAIVYLCSTLAVLPFYSIVIGINKELPGAFHVLLFKAFYLIPLISRIKDRSRNRLLSKGINSFAVLLGMGFVVHMLSCLWSMLHVDGDNDWFTQYIKALYWTTTTLTTVGYGDITPSNNVQRIFTMTVEVLGVGCYGLVIGYFSKVMTAKDKRQEQEQNQLENLDALFKHYDVSAQVQEEIYGFYRHYIETRANEEEQKLLNQLPYSLKSELQVEMNMKFLRKINIFEGVSEKCLRETARCLKLRVYSSDDLIIKKGDIGSEMYLVNHGKVKIIIDDTNHFYLSHGSFGERALLKDEPRAADVYAKTYCDLYVLKREDFCQLMIEFCDLKSNVQKITNDWLDKAS